MGSKRLIPLVNWNNILSPDPVKQGKLFENLIRDFLELKYPEFSWSSTQSTHDGKKDFQAEQPILGRDEKLQYWAECKCRTKNLSIDEISPNILFALIQEPHILLIFSYSRLNENAVKAIGSIERKKLRILCFDGINLDREIIQYETILKKHFNTTQSEIRTTGGYKEYETFISLSKDILHDNFHDINYEDSGVGYDVFLNERFVVDITVKSNNSKPIRLRITLSNLDVSIQFFNILDYEFLQKREFVVELSPGETKKVRIPFVLVKVFDSRKFSLKFDIENEESQISVKKQVLINSLWLLKTPLIGKSLKIVQNVKSQIGHRNQVICFHFHGKSGVGKSRVLEEITNDLLAFRFKITKLQGESSQLLNFSSFIRQIISQIEGLPLISPEATISETPIEDVPLPQRVMYDPNFNFEDKEQILTYLFRIAQIQNIGIIVDNSQSVDSETILFIRELVNKQVGANRLAIFLCFNTELFPADGQHPAKLFHNELKVKSSEIGHKFYSYELLGFNRLQALEFIKCILPEFEDYPETLSKIIDKTTSYKSHAEVSPLHLEQKLLYLKDRGILELSKNGLYFTDVNAFSTSFSQLPPRIMDLFSLRFWILKQSESYNNYNKIIYYIRIFRTFPKGWIRKLNLEKAEFDYLVERGFLLQNEGREYIFYHQQIEYFLDSAEEDIDLNWVSQALHFLKMERLEEGWAESRFLLEYDKHEFEVPETAVTNLAPVFFERKVDTNIIVKISEKLFSVLHSPTTSINLDLKIKLFIGICEYLKTYKSFELALSYYVKAYKDLRRNKKNSRKEGGLYFEFIKRLANSYLALHQDFVAHEIILEELKDFDSFTFINSRERDLSLAYILNRQCVTYKSLNWPNQAEDVVKKSIELSRTYKNVPLELKNLIDYGYLFYKERGNTDKLDETWGLAVSDFHNHVKEGNLRLVASREVSTYFHSALLKVIKKDLKGAKSDIEHGLSAARNKLDYFNFIKLQLTKSLTTLLEDGLDNSGIEDARQLAYSARDYSIAYGSYRSYWVVLHLLAKIELSDFRYEKSQNYYLQSLEQLSKLVVNESMELKYEYFFKDFALGLRKIKDHHSNLSLSQTMNSIRNVEYRRMILNIYNMSDLEFHEFTLSFNPSTSITDGVSNFPLP